MGGIIRSYTVNDGDERPSRRFPRGRGKRGLSIAFSLLSALLFAPSLDYFTLGIVCPPTMGPTSFNKPVTLNETLPMSLIIIKRHLV